MTNLVRTCSPSSFSRDHRAEIPANDNRFGVVSSGDALGRKLTRTEPDLSSSWVYDTASGKGIGQLASATTGSNYLRTYAYDTLGRPSTVTITVDGTANPYTTSYNSDGRILTVAYPSTFTAQYTYTTLGYLYQISDNGGTHQVFWTATSRDAELHLLTQTAGNSIVTTETFDPNTGLVQSIVAGTGNTIANQSYDFDSLGNLTSRSWLNNAGASVNENMCYDSLNRLTGTLVTSGTGCTGTGAVAVSYDALGNITEKTDICATANCMAYGAGSAGPHALTSITGTYNGVGNPTFAYDANGSMTGGAGRTITTTSFNMAGSITDGGNTAALTYDTEHARVKQVATGANAGTTYYLNDPTSGAMEENFSIAAGTTWRDYIIADGHMVALRSVGVAAPPQWGAVPWGSFDWSSFSSPTLVYFTLDHLGSISVVTDAAGHVLERDSYDAWGKRRNSDGTAASCGAIASNTTRGFTGQEMMDSVCYVNFNARVYDPSLGRFMSADPVVGTPYIPQELNRYSYVINNPLSLIDPSGLCFLGCFWENGLIRDILAIIAAVVLQQYEVLPAIGGELGFVTTDEALATVVNAGIIGGVAGAIASGTLKGAALGALQGGLFAEAGNILQDAGASGFAGLGPDASTFIAHGLVGGLVSEVGGGNFGSGFLAGGFSSLGPEPGVDQTWEETAEGTAEHAVLGGLGSVLGGGKFQNGAITGAFAYLFNELQHATNGDPNTNPPAACANNPCADYSRYNTGDCSMYGCGGPTNGTFDPLTAGITYGEGPAGVVECDTSGSCYAGGGGGLGLSEKFTGTAEPDITQFTLGSEPYGGVINLQINLGVDFGGSLEIFANSTGISGNLSFGPTNGLSGTITGGYRTLPIVQKPNP